MSLSSSNPMWLRLIPGAGILLLGYKYLQHVAVQRTGCTMTGWESIGRVGRPWW